MSRHRIRPRLPHAGQSCVRAGRSLDAATIPAHSYTEAMRAVGNSEVILRSSRAFSHTNPKRKRRLASSLTRSIVSAAATLASKAPPSIMISCSGRWVTFGGFTLPSDHRGRPRCIGNLLLTPTRDLPRRPKWSLGVFCLTVSSFEFQVSGC